MGIQDRDYMRKPRPKGANSSHKSFRTFGIGISVLIICLFIWSKRQTNKAEAAQSQEIDRILREQTVRRSRAIQQIEVRKRALELEKLKRPKAIEPIDVNKAGLNDLVKIPIISDAMARDLISKRPFTEWKELDDVYNIGEKRLEALKPYLFIDTAPDDREMPLADPQQSKPDTHSPDKPT